MPDSLTNVDLLVQKGVELQAAGHIDDATKIFKEVLVADPANAVALYSLAAIHINQGRAQDGFLYAVRCINAVPTAALAWFVYGSAQKALKRFDDAIISFDRALGFNPHYIEALLEKGATYAEKQDFVNAIAQYQAVLGIDPANALALRNKAALEPFVGAAAGMDIGKLTQRALEHQAAGEVPEARAIFERILEVDSRNFVALYSLAAMCINRGENEAGISFAQRCCDSEPASAFGWYIKGCALKSVRRFQEALECLDRAVQIAPDYKEAFIEKGLIFGELKDYFQALVQFNNVLALDVDYKLALVNLATVLTILKKNDEASKYFERLLQLEPDHEYTRGSLLYARLHACNWTDFHHTRDLVIEGLRQGKRTCRSLAFLAISDSPADQLKCAELFTEQAYALRSEQLWRGEKYQHSKIRIGYVSPDLREHPVGHLMVGVFEHHNKEKYEIYAYSLGVNDNSSLRARYIAASDHFIDVRGQSSREIALRIREDEIDLLIDLAGPTMDAQPDIFAYRPAPRQAGYLGYPGTTGASYIDYILADDIVVPEANRQFYREKLVALPGCYLPTDGSLKVSERTPSRQEMNLPEEGFVFCSFNHDYKINPDIFDVWMRILHRVEKSVLWLMKLNDAAEANLRKEAEARGVSADRLIFATRVPAIEDHLARYRLAGIFLDTYPYNAHTTATDALRSGLPVLTMAGNSYQSRVATSILHSIGMEELSKPNLCEYEEFAVLMANSPEALRSLKSKLNEHIAGAPVFDSAVKAKQIEAAFDKMLG